MHLGIPSYRMRKRPSSLPYPIISSKKTGFSLLTSHAATLSDAPIVRLSCLFHLLPDTVMKLFRGQIAPDFSITTVHDQPFQLNSLKGKKFMVVFFRNTSCPFCNLHLHKLQMIKDTELAGLEMVFVFESKKEVIRMSSFHSHIPGIPIISDPAKELYHLFGVEFSVAKQLRSMLYSSYYSQLVDAKKLGLDQGPRQKETSDSLMPADFLVNEQFMIEKAHYGKALNDHLAIEEIIEFAKKNKIAVY